MILSPGEIKHRPQSEPRWRAAAYLGIEMPTAATGIAVVTHPVDARAAGAGEVALRFFLRGPRSPHLRWGAWTLPPGRS